MEHWVSMRKTLTAPQASHFGLLFSRGSVLHVGPRSSSVTAKLSMQHPSGGGNRQSGHQLHVEQAASGMVTDSWQHSLANCCWATSDHPTDK